MWLVVVVDDFYPSVFHFDNESDARMSYESNKGEGHVVHLTKVCDSHYDEVNYDHYDKNKVETLDVAWYTNR